MCVSLLTLAWNLGTGIGFLSGLCTLRSIMDWLSSETAPLDPPWSCPGELSWGWILFIRSLRELKLSDCGSFRIKGFYDYRTGSQFLHQGLTGYFSTALTHPRGPRALHFLVVFIHSGLLLYHGFGTLSSSRGERSLIVILLNGSLLRPFGYSVF